MSNVKKAFQPLVELLEANKDKKVSAIMDQVVSLVSASAKRVVSTALRNEKNEVVAIHDYYFKRWMPLVGDKAVEFGKKEGTTTGFNSMCKAGVSNWTKQQRVAAEARDKLLKDVASGAVPPASMTKALEDIEAARLAIAPTDLGFATEDEVKAYLTKAGVKLAA